MGAFWTQWSHKTGLRFPFINWHHVSTKCNLVISEEVLFNMFMGQAAFWRDEILKWTIWLFYKDVTSQTLIYSWTCCHVMTAAWSLMQMERICLLHRVGHELILRLFPVGQVRLIFTRLKWRYTCLNFWAGTTWQDFMYPKLCWHRKASNFTCPVGQVGWEVHLSDRYSCPGQSGNP